MSIFIYERLCSHKSKVCLHTKLLGIYPPHRTNYLISGAQLTLSTARPCIGGNLPELKTLDVSIYRPPQPSAFFSSQGLLVIVIISSSASSLTSHINSSHESDLSVMYNSKVHENDYDSIPFMFILIFLR